MRNTKGHGNEPGMGGQTKLAQYSRVWTILFFELVHLFERCRLTALSEAAALSGQVVNEEGHPVTHKLKRAEG